MIPKKKNPDTAEYRFNEQRDVRSAAGEKDKQVHRQRRVPVGRAHGDDRSALTGAGVTKAWANPAAG